MIKISAMFGLAGAVLLALSFMPVVPQAHDLPMIAPAARGKALFRAKGCAACHAHAAVESSDFEVGPNLTNYRADPAYLQRWLRDPQAVKPTTSMPNLHLSDDEVEALIAFLSENGTAH